MLRNKYPIETAEQVKTASAFVRDHLTRFDPVDRAAAAYRLEKRASQLGVCIEDSWVANYSRFFDAEAGYSPEFGTAMAMRKEACLGRVVAAGNGTVPAGDVVDALEKAAASLAPQDLAGLIDEFDKVAGLELDYDTRIMDPIFTVVGCTNDPYYNQVKVAGMPESLLKHKLRNNETLDKIASVIGEHNAPVLREDPVAFLKSNPFVTNIVKDICEAGC